MSLNHVAISGNITRDPELRPSGALPFTVAVNERVKDKKTDVWTERPNFIDCVTFGTRAESLSRFLRRGMKVALTGRLRWSKWEDKDTGKSRSRVEVIVDDLEFMSRRGEYESTPSEPVEDVPEQPGAPAASGFYDEEVPF